ncbi:MAG: hypothetical protein IH951_15965 [Bacteroidetes bacterium]|nr:hypothetical protein [Bacteroidota bacterium]
MRFTVPVDEAEESPPIKPAEIAEPPVWLGADARAIFADRVSEITEAGYWHARFVDSLALYASLMAEYQRDSAKCSAAKVTQMRLLLSELGLTPQSSRGVMHGPNR